MNKTIFLTIGVMIIAASGAVFAQEGVKYEFDEVEVKYAAEFTATPVSVGADNWIVGIAGGIDKPIKVLYGVVNLLEDGEIQMSEEFIKVSGEGGSERFLLNSAAFDYYEGGGNYRQIKSFFWSAKKLIDSTVVKDFTLPIWSISFFRKFNQDQEATSLILYFSNDGQQAGQDFWAWLIR